MIEDPRIKTLTVELGQLKDIVNKVHAKLEIERLDYGIIQSEFTNLKVRNQKLKDENLEVEEKIRQSLEAADKIIADAKEESAKIRSNNMIKMTTVNARLKELDKFIEKADKKRISEHLEAINS